MQTINDWEDREIDAINEPYRPIPSGKISGPQVEALLPCCAHRPRECVGCRVDREEGGLGPPPPPPPPWTPDRLIGRAYSQQRVLQSSYPPLAWKS